MAIRVALTHRTSYRYDRPVTLSPQVVRLRPAPALPHADPRATRCASSRSRTSSTGSRTRTATTWPGSSSPSRRASFDVEVDLVAEMTVDQPVRLLPRAGGREVPVRATTRRSARELAPYLDAAPAGPRLQALRRRSPRSRHADDRLPGRAQPARCSRRHPLRHPHGAGRADAARRRCEKRQRLVPRHRPGCWCRLLRHLGLAARFVSGYLIQLAADVKPLDGPSGPEPPTSPTCTPGPRSTCPAPAGSASTRRRACSPARGTSRWPAPPSPTSAPRRPIQRRQPDEDAEVARSSRFHMSRARASTKTRASPSRTPRSSGARSTRSAERVDAELRARRRAADDGRRADVRLASTTSTAPEWNTAALGPRQAPAGRRRCCAGCATRFAPGGLLHYGQGKWYPGEPLPRWALGCYWRRDGEPIWHDPTLDRRRRRSDYGHGADEARALHRRRSPQRLGVDPGTARARLRGRLVLPVARAALAGQRRSAATAALDDAEERTRLARVFEQGLSEVVGYALPLRRGRDGPERRWESGPWFFRARAPVPDPRRLADGLPPAARLPAVGSRAEIASRRRARSVRAARRRCRIAAAPAADRRERTPAGAVDAPAARQQRRAGPRDRSTTSADRESCARRCASSRATAGCTSSCRRVTHLEDYLDLVAAIEATAAALGMPVLIEGYPPPHDHRLDALQGHARSRRDRGEHAPGRSWDELVEHHDRRCTRRRGRRRLGTEKFMLDGRHTGTGGGNHVVLGGADAGRQPVPAPARPAAQPGRLLAQPPVAVVPVLAACSSARPARPRASTRRATTASTSWRSRFAPDRRRRQRPDCPAVAGRPRLPPPAGRRDRQHAPGRVLHRQALLARHRRRPARAGRAARLRDAAARADEPGAAAAAARARRLLLEGSRTDARSVRWGTELHDRFMLPHFVEQDFDDVLGELQRGRLSAFEAEWFAPHLEFRFPLLGAVTLPRRRARAAPGHRALARARRGGRPAAARRATSIRRSSGCR